MDFASYKKIYDACMTEHAEKYDAFTRLMLGLSVTFITLVVGLRTGETEQLSILLKSAVVLHALSILFGVWVQFLAMTQPLNDLKRAYKLAQEIKEDPKKDPGWFDRPPSKTQTYCFYTQTITFIFAFFVVVISVLL